MPIYMDRHDVPGLTAMDVADGHQRDLKIQHKFNCRALTYWYDETREVAFCLIEAPRKEAVHHLHANAHGLIPNRIIEVESSVVEAFLGRIGNPEAMDAAETKELIGPAFRTILMTELKNGARLQSKLAPPDFNELLHRHNLIIRTAVRQHQGREVEYGDSGIMAAFNIVLNAIECALEIRSRFQHDNRQHADRAMHMAIGISTGDPVTKKEGIFGEAVEFGKRLCHIAGNDQIVISSSVRDYYKQKRFSHLQGGDHLKFLRPDEESFLNQLMDTAEKIWNKEDLSVIDLGRHMGLSKSQLYRKITDLVDCSPNDFIRAFRLEKALGLIEKRQMNMAQIAYECGFSSPSYFAKCFKERYGIPPSAYA